MMICATKRSMHALVKEVLAREAPSIDIAMCKNCDFYAACERGTITRRGYRYYYLYWESYKAYFSKWMGAGRLTISSTDGFSLTVDIPMSELKSRRMVKD